MTGTCSSPGLYCQSLAAASTKLSGTASKNISVFKGSAPCMLMAADTLYCEEVKAPTFLQNGCLRTSSMSNELKALLRPESVPTVVMCFDTTKKLLFIKLSSSVNTGIISL